MKGEHIELLSPDRPTSHPDDDRLGYAPFAEHLAESITKMAPVDGLVIGIYGPWGSGKTTLVNFILYHLAKTPEDSRPIVIQFNPWWFSGHEDLTRRFFDQLRAVLSKHRKFAADITKRLADFADIVAEMPIPYASTVKPVGKALRGKPKDVTELKDSIVDLLRQKQQKILVTVDDIDRLTDEEIRHLFRAIKAVADFPNVIYLLVFDKDVVIKAISQGGRISGEAYLEKIVQVPFELPLPDKVALRRLLFDKLDAILVGTPEGIFDQVHWANVYFEGIDHFVSTPRDIVRLSNTLSVTYSAVKGEVNPVDFIAIEALRVFQPAVYDVIRANADYFAGRFGEGAYQRDEGSGLRSFHDAWLKELSEDDREPVKMLLGRLFPKFSAAWNNTIYGSDYEAEWRRKSRVCSTDIFPVYFRLAITENGISRTEMQAVLALLDDADALRNKLIQLANQRVPDGSTRARLLLERLEDYTRSEIRAEAIPIVVKALFDVGDHLLRPEDESRGMWGFGNNIRIGRVIHQLMRRLDEPSRFSVLKEAIHEGRALSVIVRQVGIFGQEHGKYGRQQRDPEHWRTVTAQHLQELEGFALAKIRRAAGDGSLLQTPDLPNVLYRWRDWTGEDEARRWVHAMAQSDDDLIEFLVKFLGKGYTQYVSDVVGRVNYRLDPAVLEPFLEPSQIIGRVRRLAERPDLTEMQRTALRQLVKEYEHREKGGDPNELDD